MFKRVPGTILVLTLGLTLAACGGGTRSDSGDSTTNPPSASAPAPAPAPDEHNAVDVMFATMMKPHHEGAIEMSDLALTQAATPQIKDLAGRIKAAQAPEIAQMKTWLAAWGATMPMTSTGTGTGSGMGGHDMGSMGGSEDPSTTTDPSIPSSGPDDDFGMGAMMMSMSESDMAALRAATGVAFDKLFLQQMIAHHQGAIDMAGVETAQGRSPQALALAAAIGTGQAAEIAEMRQLLATL